MCDDDTEQDNAAYLAQEQTRIKRRAWAKGAGAAIAGVVTGCAGAKTPDATASPAALSTTAVPTEVDPAATTNRMVTIETQAGTAEAFFVAPDSGQHPAVLIWPDVAGLRDAFHTMATRLAAEGYAVLAVNPYYRSSKLPVLTEFSEWQTEEGRAKIRPMIEALSSEGISDDGAAFVAWLDQQPQVDTQRKIGTTGYCMGGPFTFRTAAAAPDRVGAIGSFHGGGLVTEEVDSPHQLLAKMNAAALVCVASSDDDRDPKARTTLQEAAATANVTAEVEVYPAQHGWCVIDSPVYDPEQADRAWGRMLATFEAHL